MTAPSGNTTDAFVGRDAELDILRMELERVRSGSPRVVLIDGPAGMGKTALADRFLHGGSAAPHPSPIPGEPAIIIIKPTATRRSL